MSLTSFLIRIILLVIPGIIGSLLYRNMRGTKSFDELATRNNYIRVVDETGEDYLYPAEYFVPVSLPPEAIKALIVTAH